MSVKVSGSNCYGKPEYAPIFTSKYDNSEPTKCMWVVAERFFTEAVMY